MFVLVTTCKYILEIMDTVECNAINVMMLSPPSIWEDLMKGQESVGVSICTSQRLVQNKQSPCHVEMSYFYHPP